MTAWILSTCVLVLVCLALRHAFRGRVDPRLTYGLWLLAALRILVPFSPIPSALSVDALVEQSGIGERVAQARYTPRVVSTYGSNSGNRSPAEYIASMENADWFQQSLQETYGSVTPVQILSAQEATPEEVKELGGTAGQSYMRMEILTIRDRFAWLRWLWGGGAAVTAAALLAVNLSFHRRLKRCRKPYEGKLRLPCPVPVYVAPFLPSPCLFGLWRPAIYLNAAALESGHLNHILIHELTHHRHRDHLWALLRSLCLVVQWFNPLVWLAAHLSRQDCELACDASAIRALGEGQRLSYGKTLVDMVAQGRTPGQLLHTATTMTAGKHGLRERVTLIARGHRMTALTLAAVVLVAAVAAGCSFASAPAAQSDAPDPAAFDTPAAPSPDATDPISEDDLEAILTSIRVDGSVDGYEEAAALFAQQLADSLRALPAGSSRANEDVRVNAVSLYDAYYGEEENFSANLSFYVKVEDETSADRWQAGAGLTGRGAGEFADYWHWGIQVLVDRDAGGDWKCYGWGVAGCTAMIPSEPDYMTCSELVEAFTLTSGVSHERRIPYALVSRATTTPDDLVDALETMSDQDRAELLYRMGCDAQSENAFAAVNAILPDDWKADFASGRRDGDPEAVWTSVRVDGSVTDHEEVAALFAQQVAANYRALPAASDMANEDVQVNSTSVFDAYYGEEENFCAGLSFYVKVENAVTALDWQAGAGLSSRGDGQFADYWHWGRECLFRRDENGDWYCPDFGTGGYSVLLPEKDPDPNVSYIQHLVDCFSLTAGQTHDWIIPANLFYDFADDPDAFLAALESMSDSDRAELLYHMGYAATHHDRAYVDALYDLLPEKWHDELAVEFFEQDGLVMAVHGVREVRTETIMDHGVTPHEYAVFVLDPGASAYVWEAGLSDPAYAADGQAHPQYAYILAPEGERERITEALTLRELTPDVLGVAHLEASLYVLRFEYVYEE